MPVQDCMDSRHGFVFWALIGYGMKDVALSIITSVYKTAPYLESWVEQSVVAAQKMTPDFELVIVNDGSPDEALKTALHLQSLDSRITVIDLSRNFGQHAAIWTGLQHARGDLIFYLDSDLEESPQWLDNYLVAMHAGAADVVYGVRAGRDNSRVWYNRAIKWFYWLLDHVSEVEFKRNIVNARLMNRAYLLALLSHTERNIDLSILCHLTGFKQAVVTVEKGQRTQSSFTPMKLAIVANNILVSTSLMPLYLVSMVTGVLALGAVAISAFYVFGGIWNLSVAAFASSVSVLSSAVLLGSISVISLYLAAVMKEVRARPVSIIRRIYRSRNE